jgi:5-methylcytosine-specific restriction protein B
MNTADRSIRSIDIALRRRFDVIECPPDVQILQRFYQQGRGVNQVTSLYEGLERLNERLRASLDRHHTIGHTFFMASELTSALLKKVWKRKLGPLIEEYFFDRPDFADEFQPEKYWPELG